jgi:hypothetical protein
MRLQQTAYVTSPSTTHQAHQQCPQHTINRNPINKQHQHHTQNESEQQRTTIGNK